MTTAEVLERRAVPRPVEFRKAAEGAASPGTLVGYAATFNSTSRDLGGWFEEIDPGAFGENGVDGLLDMTAHTRVIARSEHDSRLLLGTTDAATLRLFVDDIGLRYEVDLPNTTAGRDAAVLAERGDYRFSSFAFYTVRKSDEEAGAIWREDAEGRLIRRVMHTRLVDVAPVADPAYWGSSVGMRDFNLDEIRAALHSDAEQTSEPAPPGDFERAATDRARAIENRGRDFRRGNQSGNRRRKVV